MRTRF